MDHAPVGIHELEDLLKKLDDQESMVDDRHFLLNEVRFSDLRKMNDANLEGRLAYYERDYTFELNPKKRNEFYREVIRTKIEIRQRALTKRRALAEAAISADPEPAQTERRTDADAAWNWVTRRAAA